MQTWKFVKILQHCNTGHFSHFGSYFGKNDQIVMKILSHMYLWTRNSLLTSGSHLTSNADQSCQVCIRVVCSLWELAIIRLITAPQTIKHL